VQWVADHSNAEFLGSRFQVRAIVVGGLCRSRFATGRFSSGCGLRAAFAVRLLQISIGCLLCAAGVVIGLFRFAVFVDGALALPEQIENHP
jgi:hypothetical protein